MDFKWEDVGCDSMQWCTHFTHTHTHENTRRDQQVYKEHIERHHYVLNGVGKPVDQFEALLAWSRFALWETDAHLACPA